MEFITSKQVFIELCMTLNQSAKMKLCGCSHIATHNVNYCFE